MKVDMVQNGQKVSLLFKFHFLEIWNSNSLFVYKCNHETYSSETFWFFSQVFYESLYLLTQA